MIMYKQYFYKDGSIANGIKRRADEAYIPFDPDNTDYQEYLAWVAEGNTPLPADEGTI